MKEMLLIIILLLPTTAFIIAGLLGSLKLNSKSVIPLTRITSYVGIAISLIGIYWVLDFGNVLSPQLTMADLGVSFRLDTLSVIMYLMVSIIGLVVLRFSYNYLEGDENHTKFIGWLSLTIALVQVLVISGNLFLFFAAWVGTSLALNKLLLFYPNRRNAKLGAQKKNIVARLGDISLLIAFTLIYVELETGDLETIFSLATTLESGSLLLELSIVFLVLCAAFKSAQLPLHGWLLEVMEAPTPVSALLHAGLLNAGPFLMIRFSYVLDAVYFAPILLFTIGAITALYGAIVFTTQPTIKTSLAYSSVGHMGFTLMTCGLGLYSAALLHLVSHSFYKAHAFLSSGSLIDKVRTHQKYGFERKGNVLKIILAFITALGLYGVIANTWGITLETEFQLLIIGGVIYSGSATLLVNSFDSTSSFKSIVKVLGISVLVVNMFFALEGLMSFYIGDTIPEISQPSLLLMIISGGMLILFFLTILLQSIFPMMNLKMSYRNFGIHVRNGFYLNVFMNKLVRSLDHKS